MTATFPLWSQETYATLLSGATITSCGLAGTSMEFDAVLGLAPQLADALGIHLLD